MTGALVALPLVAPSIEAQRLETSIDAGAMALRYADTVSTGAAVVTPHVYADWGAGFADASATLSRFTAGGWSAQGSVSGSRFIPTNRSFVAEISGLAGGSTHNDGTRTGEAIATGRLHFSRGVSELFVGAGIGRTWDGDAWRSLQLGEVGVSIGPPSRNAVLSVSPAAVNDSIYYADLQGSIVLETGYLQLGATAGSRFGDRITTLSDATSWASVYATRRINDLLAVSLSGGTYPIDPTQGFPGGRFVSLAVRIAPRRRVVPAPAPQEIDIPVAASSLVPTVSSFSSGRDRDGVLALRVTAPGAHLVEINGDFTSWVPMKLTRDQHDATRWTARLPVGPGKYQMNVRIDGGKWIVPPGILSMRDEFGGSVGLLIVE
jgi:hypothetical protein